MKRALVERNRFNPPGVANLPMETHLPDITETIPDAAAQILAHSFAVYRVEGATATKIRAAYRAAAGFFNETTNEGATATANEEKSNLTRDQDCFEKYRRVKNGNLYGYNIPLPSKKLFRTWYDCSTKEKDVGGQDEQELEYFRCQQPWSSNAFCEASFHVAKDLHRLLSECLSHIYMVQKNGFCAGNRFEEDKTGGDSDVSVSKTAQGQKRPRKPVSTTPLTQKRFRGSAGVTPFHRESDSGNGTSIGKDCDEKNSSERPLFCPIACPLDYFFYHNKFPSEINCSEHVDRGALVVVCLTDVPGLEVRSSSLSQTSAFRCPEALVHNTNLYLERNDDSCYPSLVCIMAGDQLCRLLPTTNAPNACVHRVRNPLRRARLSISYELRLVDV